MKLCACATGDWDWRNMSMEDVWFGSDDHSGSFLWGGQPGRNIWADCQVLWHHLKRLITVLHKHEFTYQQTTESPTNFVMWLHILMKLHMNWIHFYQLVHMISACEQSNIMARQSETGTTILEGNKRGRSQRHDPSQRNTQRTTDSSLTWEEHMKNHWLNEAHFY